MWTPVLPIADPGRPATAYTAGLHGEQPEMGMGFFVIESGGHRYIYHDGDQGGFSSELLVDPTGHSASILVVNTTETSPKPNETTLHPQSNTEPEPATDLRRTLRKLLIEKLFSGLANPG